MTGRTVAAGSGTGLPRTPRRTHMDMDATSDSGGVRRTGPEAARDAPIVDLGEVRRRRMTGAGRIPDEVWDAVARADELVDDLAARGQRVQFDTDAGRV